MENRKLILAILLVSYIAAAEATLLAAAAGLAALKGAAIVGYAVGRHHRRRGYRGAHRPGHYRNRGHGGYGHHRYGRSVGNQEAVKDEDMLLSVVGQLDVDGCISKLLCHLQFKDERELTQQEGLFVDMFDSSTQNVGSANAPFVHAPLIDVKSHDPSVCESSYPLCALPPSQLAVLLEEVWGCGSSVL